MAEPVIVGTIHCPACQSEITLDGKELRARSAKLLEWQKLEKALPKLAARLDELEKKPKEVPARVEKPVEKGKQSDGDGESGRGGFLSRRRSRSGSG